MYVVNNFEQEMFAQVVKPKNVISKDSYYEVRVDLK